MSRNRVKNSQSLHWMGVVKWVLIAGLLSMLGLSYMLCKNQNLHLAEETHRLELQLNAIDQRNKELALDYYTMKSPVRLQRRLAQMRSSLVLLSDGTRDGTLTVYRMEDQGARMRLAHLGTVPEAPMNYSSPLNFNSSVVATSSLTPRLTTPRPAQ
jgi:hypothetical protein